MKKVFVAQHPTEAHLVKGLLESHGIAAEVQGESLFGARGEAPITADTLPSLWVLDDSQVEKAIQILRVREEGEPWQCAGCGEAIERQFGNCWRCGAERPDAT
jgi:hypothetical protein